MKNCKLLLALTALMLTGCKQVEYVMMPVVHTDTLYQSKVQRDSVYVHDSVVVEHAGDTITISRWRDRWRDRWRIDTIYRSSVDSIPYPVEVQVEVERKLTWMQQTQIYIGRLSVLLIVLFIAYNVWKERQ